MEFIIILMSVFIFSLSLLCCFLILTIYNKQNIVITIKKKEHELLELFLQEQLLLRKIRKLNRYNGDNFSNQIKNWAKEEFMKLNNDIKENRNYIETTINEISSLKYNFNHRN